MRQQASKDLGQVTREDAERGAEFLAEVESKPRRGVEFKPIIALASDCAAFQIYTKEESIRRNLLPDYLVLKVLT